MSQSMERNGFPSDPKWEEKKFALQMNQLWGGMQFRWPINKADKIIFFLILHPGKVSFTDVQ